MSIQRQYNMSEISAENYTLMDMSIMTSVWKIIDSAKTDCNAVLIDLESVWKVTEKPTRLQFEKN